MVKVCENCNEEYETKHKVQKFCSMDCFGMTRRTKDRFTYTCLHCGKEEETTRTNQKFCSMDCKMDYTDKRVPKHTCLICGEHFRRRVQGINNENKYCSLACSNSSEAKGWEAKKKKGDEIHTYICEECGVKCTRKDSVSTRRQKFCSISCANTSRWRKRRDAISK